MESIMRIVTALAAGAVAAEGEMAEKAVKDAYAGLKALVLDRLARKAEVDAAIRLLEQRPDSDGRKTALAEELAAAGAGNDGELAKAGQALLDLLEDGLLTAGSQATVVGSGAVAQGARTVAAGAGGIAIGRDFRVY
jgi:hypothetical protein